MNRFPPALAVVIAALALCASGSAWAQHSVRPTVTPPRSEAGAARPPVTPPRSDTGAARPPEAPASTRAAPPPAAEPGARVRSSHTVDVIAPGEKVDTIIGRLRTDGAAVPPPPRGDAGRPPSGGEQPPKPSGQGPGRADGPPPSSQPPPFQPRR
jgi:hypothetical protein